MNLGAQLLQYTLSGITIGSLYAMVAIGFNIIYNATGIINLAQGDFVMLGGMTAVYFHNTLHMPLLASGLFAVLIVTAIGIGFERFAISSLKNPSVITLIIIKEDGVSFLWKLLKKI